MASAADNLLEKAKKKFEKKDYERSKFLFQRNIVFNPKSSIYYVLKENYGFFKITT